METLPETLWPTAGNEVATGFLATTDSWFWLSFLAGLLVLMTYSWHRLFTEHHFDADEKPDKILRLLPPGDLRGKITMARAFLVYTLLIGGLYTLFSFAGAFVWQVIEVFRLGELAGQTSFKDTIQADDPAWPLFVSLAFIGVFNHIPKVDLVEKTIRRWAHRSIGIPPYIRNLTDGVMRTNLPVDGGTPFHQRHNENAAFQAMVTKVDGTVDAERLRTRMDRIAYFEEHVLSERPHWPRTSVTSRFDRMLREMRQDVKDLFDDADGAALMFDGVSATPESDLEQRKFNQAQRKCNELAQKSAVVERDLASLVAVFAENDPIVPEVAGPVLKDFVAAFLTSSRQSNWIADKLLWILLILGTFVFLATWIATNFELTSRVSAYGPFGTAVFHMVLMTLTYLPATLVGLSIQQSLASKNDWSGWERNERGLFPIGQYVSVFFSAYVPALLLIVVFFFVFFVTTTPTQTNAMRFFLDFGPLYFGYAILGGLQGVFSAYAISESKDRLTDNWRVPGLHALMVLAVLCIFYESFSDKLAGPDKSAVVANLFIIIQSTLVAFVATFLSASGEKEKPTPEPEGHGIPMEAAE